MEVAGYVLLGIGGLLAFVAFDTLVMGYMWRLKKNRFEILRDDRHAFRFRSDLGTFTIDRKQRLLRIDTAAGAEALPLEWVERLDFGFSTELALWNDMLNGTDWWDLSKRYADVVQWYRISIFDLNDKRLVPLFVVGQYLPKEPLGQPIFDRQADWLQRLGLFRDVEERAHEVLRQLEVAFAASDHPITLTPDWVKKKKQAATDAANTKNDTPPLAT